MRGKPRKGAGAVTNARVPKGKSRLNIVLDESLKKWVQKYAARNKTTVTHIIHATFVKLQRGDMGVEVLDDDIMAWAREYALKNHTTVPNLITRLLVDLRKEESGIGVRQI